jgi:hypothetical protein
VQCSTKPRSVVSLCCHCHLGSAALTYFPCCHDTESGHYSGCSEEGVDLWRTKECQRQLPIEGVCTRFTQSSRNGQGHSYGRYSGTKPRGFWDEHRLVDIDAMHGNVIILGGGKSVDSLETMTFTSMAFSSTSPHPISFAIHLLFSVNGRGQRGA